MITYVIKCISDEGRILDPQKYAGDYIRETCNVFYEYDTVEAAHLALKEYAAQEFHHYRADGFVILPMFTNENIKSRNADSR